jgi:sarcosine oxidase/L-pipecolate oxidase
MPDEGFDDIKRLIATLLPDLVGRELVEAKMCWCTGALRPHPPLLVERQADHTISCPVKDTADAEWLFCEDPRWAHLFLATGDSGHSFNTIPFVGSQVADLLEGKVRRAVQASFARFPPLPMG